MSKFLYFCLGLMFLMVGIAGLILPGLPGTFPLILAAGFFAKSDPRIERWMLDHRHIGPPIKSWREDRSISRKHKTIAITMLWCSILLVCFTAPPIGAAAAVLCAIGVTVYLLTRPTRITDISTARMSDEKPVDAC